MARQSNGRRAGRLRSSPLIEPTAQGGREEMKRTTYSIQVTKPDNGSIVPTAFSVNSHRNDKEAYVKAFNFLCEAVQPNWKVELIETTTEDNTKGVPV
jgi:hypothetical protein